MAHKKAATKKRGRPSYYTKALAKKICDRLATGETLRSVCRDADMPQEPTVRNWAVEDKEGFFAQYARARDIGIDAMGEESMDIVDDGSNDWMEKHGEDGAVAWQLNGEHIQRSKLRVDYRKWYMAKMAPKRYGDKTHLEHTGADGADLKFTFNLGD